MSRGGRLEKHNINRRTSLGTGFADEATHQLMVVLVTKIVYLGRGRAQACTGGNGNQRDTRLPEELVQREGVSRGHDVTTTAGREHDIIRQVPS